MKKQLLFFMTLFWSVWSFGQNVGDSFTSDDIAYNITSISPATVEVGSQNGFNTFNGPIANIPSIVTYAGTDYSVTSVGYQAFNSCGNLTSVIIPNSVISIEQEAFSGSGLTSVIIGNSVTSIGAGAFGYTHLTTVTIPNSVISIGNDVFAYCEDLTSVALGNSLTSISSWIFDNCINLTSVTIPNSVTSIENYAFNNCTNLTSITIPNSVTSIGYGAFIGSGLTSIIIPDSVTSIVGYTFEYCNNLTSVTIPNSVTNIEVSAFGFCPNLNSVMVNWSSPLPINADVFQNTPISSATLIVPAQTKALYQAASVWQNFASIVEPATHLNFDGANDSVNLPVNIGNNLSGGTEVTIEYWFKGTNVQSAVRIQNASNWIVAGWNLAGNPQFLVSTDGGTNGVVIANSSSIQDNTWHHVACVWKKNEIFATYLDGVLQNSRVAANVNLPVFSGNNGFLGSLVGSSEFTNGSLDEVRIWNTVRTAEQINGSANCELQGNEAGLLAYYKFNQGLDAADNTSITSLSDATANANNGTLVNFALNGSTSNFLAGSPVTTGSIIPALATVTTPVTYTQGATANALTATVGANGTGLIWYTTATGGTGTTTAPTPSTVNPGNTSYWVASTNANGCQSARTEIVVQVNASTTAGCWAKIASGEDHTVAIAQNGTLWAWGRNVYGQLGDGTNTTRTFPTQIGTATNWQSIFCGFDHTVAIKTDGTLWAWGRNNYGQLGDGTAINKTDPVQVGTPTNWQSISGGVYHTVAIKTDGTLWVWGRNNTGQLGDGTTTNKNIPTQIGTATTWQSISGGVYHTVAIKTDGTLWAWGYNNYGQLGDGTTISKNIPTQIGTAITWRNISCGKYHTVAIKTDGTLWAWGENFSGQLGDGTSTNKYIPTQIGTANTWQSISGGEFHTVAIKTDGTLWAWGYNFDGQLGDGTTISKNIPTPIGTATTWQSISGQGTHTMAIKTDGTLWAWGYNIYSQLGLGDINNRNTPTEVACPAVLGNESFEIANNIKMFPNPATNNITIDLISLDNSSVEVYDINGRKLFTQKLNNTSNNIDIANLATGIYLFKVISDQGSATSKVIKQ